MNTLNSECVLALWKGGKFVYQVAERPEVGFEVVCLVLREFGGHVIESKMRVRVGGVGGMWDVSMRSARREQERRYEGAMLTSTYVVAKLACASILTI